MELVIRRLGLWSNLLIFSEAEHDIQKICYKNESFVGLMNELR